MRATSLIPYFCKEKNIIVKNVSEYILYIQDKFKYIFYKNVYLCIHCGIECTAISCYLYNYSSKIKCEIIRYRFYCSNKLDLYDIILDGKMIKIKI